MSLFMFILFLLIIVLVYFLIKKIYVNDLIRKKRLRKRELRAREFIHEAFKIENLKEIRHNHSNIRLIFEQKTIDVEEMQIVFVDTLLQEKANTSFEVSDKTKREEVFNLLVKNTTFYITKDRYKSLKTSTDD
ncbi:hypothetical protein G5S33_02523 [Staphylococcus cohnii subsp. cohnii]|uniref:hypothetical protein n=1 Tax=Staphylococcus cohnii TaxID=29382 RepID=UPI0016026310|nr:hypothetical protein [Staphylococcus cohnii]MBB2509077.1 hypothetical protein [Staphylococcus cohnii subsp. barensis]